MGLQPGFCHCLESLQKSNTQVLLSHSIFLVHLVLSILALTTVPSDLMETWTLLFLLFLPRLSVPNRLPQKLKQLSLMELFWLLLASSLILLKQLRIYHSPQVLCVYKIFAPFCSTDYSLLHQENLRLPDMLSLNSQPPSTHTRRPSTPTPSLTASLESQWMRCLTSIQGQPLLLW